MTYFRRGSILLATTAAAFAVGAPGPGSAQQQPRPATTGTAATTALATPAANPPMTDSVRHGALDLELLPDSRTGVQWGRATGIVEAPPDVVMRIVTDYARYREFLPHFDASRVLSRRGNNAIVYLQVRAVRETTTLWAQLRIFQRRPRGLTQIIEGRMMQGNVARMDARWEVTPLVGGARTLVAFQFLIDPDLPFPDSIVTNENRRVTRLSLEALRRRVNEPRFRVARRAP